MTAVLVAVTALALMAVWWAPALQVLYKTSLPHPSTVIPLIRRAQRVGISDQVLVMQARHVRPDSSPHLGWDSFSGPVYFESMPDPGHHLIVWCEDSSVSSTKSQLWYFTCDMSSPPWNRRWRLHSITVLGNP